VACHVDRVFTDPKPCRDTFSLGPIAVKVGAIAKLLSSGMDAGICVITVTTRLRPDPSRLKTSHRGLCVYPETISVVIKVPGRSVGCCWRVTQAIAVIIKPITDLDGVRVDVRVEIITII
jgi:hypothetical protein